MGKRGRKKGCKPLKDWDKSLCWKCNNAVPTAKHGCSWSHDGIPVEGWEANPSKYSKDAYMVIKCPQFEPDRKDKYLDLTNLAAPWENLKANIVTQTAKDYMWSSRQLMEKHDEYVDAFQKTMWVEEFNRYANGLHNKYRLRYLSDEWEDWWLDIAQLVSDTRKRHTKRLLQYNRLTRQYTQNMHTIWECKRFILSDSFSLYSEMDGERLLNILNRETGFDEEYATIED